MGNVKKLVQYLIPILLLPFLGNLAHWLLTLLCTRSLGAFYMAADSLTQSLYSAAGMALYAAALAGVMLPAVLMEEGKADTAIKARRGALIVFCLLVAALGAAFLLLGPALLKLFSSQEEVLAIANASLQAGALSMLGISLIAALIGQTRSAYSMKLTLAFGAVVTALCAIAGYVTVFPLQLGVGGVGMCRGGVFAATRILPFLMIPVKSNEADISPISQEV